MTQYKRFSAVVDAMAGYDNLLGLLIGDDVIDYSTSGKDDEDTLAPSLKAAVRDMKAYSAARDYRTIPFGYFGNDDATIREALANYLVCGGNSSETIDFYGLNLFSWCGDSSYAKSGYDGTNSRFGALGVPVFLSEDGCNVIRPRKFTDQAVVFGSEMSGNWSGAVIYEWRETEYEYGLANYTSTAPASGASTPTLLPDYTNLKSQWASVTSNTHSPTTFATPSCPSQSSSYWTLDPSVTLPTIAGLNIATITPTSESATPTTVSSSTSTPEPTQHSESGLSGGSKAGIGVGVGGGVLLIVVVVVLFFYRRRKNALSNSPDQGSTVELPVATPTAELPGMGIVAQLPGSGNVAEMNAGDATHVNELQGSDPWNGPHELNDSSVHESSDGQRTSLGTQPASPGMAPARTETRP
ncbi:unnamed protein product [Penicillium salamii]|uniref:1,3-beta-glucanosyltransferase n=1 Tax=Penicillium salamii TaxID=1612424 RepID=A0A9W4NWU9_9EURO|nr:unnamed protein product [Penicillium salamii]CAG8105346.1 unnamed protein product [Penicillium salamii]CAG8384386.1 unnamed protein product [Penicillium salamii]CAG8397446.1 unnamed protein product [Penicillium salamii]CAG8406632.1 unnamed protein product [Penicillium salamii]